MGIFLTLVMAASQFGYGTGVAGSLVHWRKDAAEAPYEVNMRL